MVPRSWPSSPPLPDGNGRGLDVAQLSRSGAWPSQAAADRTVPLGTSRSATRTRSPVLGPCPSDQCIWAKRGMRGLHRGGILPLIRGFRPPRRLKTTHVAPAVQDPLTGSPSGAHQPELPTQWKAPSRFLAPAGTTHPPSLVVMHGVPGERRHESCVFQPSAPRGRLAAKLHLTINMRLACGRSLGPS